MTEPTTNSDPFAVVMWDGKPVQAGRLPGVSQRWDASHLSTGVLVGDRADEDGSVVLVIQGVLWEPPVGAVIQLAEPSRNAEVYRVQYQLTGSGLHALVYVDDSMQRLSATA